MSENGFLSWVDATPSLSHLVQEHPPKRWQRSHGRQSKAKPKLRCAANADQQLGRRKRGEKCKPSPCRHHTYLSLTQTAHPHTHIDHGCQADNLFSFFRGVWEQSPPHSDVVGRLGTWCPVSVGRPQRRLGRTAGPRAGRRR